MGRIVAAITAVAAAAMFCTAPAGADETDFSGCESVPILGLNPQIRKICDDPIRPDGSWTRYRQFVHPTYVHSTCGDYGGFVGGSYYCPPWAPKDTIPAEFGEVETYPVTADTVPPGEPGHLANPIRCSGAAFRCD